jgi:hypothetical protein
MNTRYKWAALLAGGTLVASAYAMARLDTLIINGTSHEVAIRVIDNNAYVKLADVAKAMDMTLVKKADGVYELTRAGGANQVEGIPGKIGETVFDGKWRFTVLSIETPSNYQMKHKSPPYRQGNQLNWNPSTLLVTPGEGHRLYVVTVRVSNGVNERRTLWTAPSDPRLRTALTDWEGRSYPPILYDYAGGPNQTEPLLPGAQLTFPVIFSLPSDAKVKDFVFTLRANVSGDTGKDVRIALYDTQGGGR